MQGDVRRRPKMSEDVPAWTAAVGLITNQGLHGDGNPRRPQGDRLPRDSFVTTAAGVSLGRRAAVTWRALSRRSARQRGADRASPFR
jgi:hypothetical protein